MENKTKQRLRKKLNKDNAPDIGSEAGILEMLNQMNSMLKTNPDMVNKISKCVSNIIDNKELMENITNQIKNSGVVQDQTLESSSGSVSEQQPGLSKQ
jgi:F0F1-type ATP synthase delta subunit